MNLPGGWTLNVDTEDGCYWVTIEGGDKGRAIQAFEEGTHGAEVLKRLGEDIAMSEPTDSLRKVAEDSYLLLSRLLPDYETEHVKQNEILELRREILEALKEQ